MCEALHEQDGHCFYCKAPLTEMLATVDHRKSIAHGGTDCRENIAAACYECNQVKADLNESYFFKMLNGKKPPKRGGSAMLLVWSSRRIWKRTHKASVRIERASRSVIVASASIETPAGEQHERAGT